MISEGKRYNIKITFEKLQEAYSNLNIAGAQDYFLTLGNVNEVHLIKKDATKSVFLGKLFIDENSPKEVEAKKIWVALQNYFMGTTNPQPQVVEEVEKAPKKTRKSKKVEVVEEPEVMEADEDSDWVDTVL